MCRQRGTKPAVVRDRDDGWKSNFVTVLLRINFEREHYMTEPMLGYQPTQVGQNAMINLIISFVYTSLTSGRAQASFSCYTNSSSSLANFDFSRH